MKNILSQDANPPESPSELLTLQAQMMISIFNFSNLLTRYWTKQKESYYSLKNWCCDRLRIRPCYSWTCGQFLQYSMMFLPQFKWHSSWILEGQNWVNGWDVRELKGQNWCRGLVRHAGWRRRLLCLGLWWDRNDTWTVQPD